MLSQHGVSSPVQAVVSLSCLWGQNEARQTASRRSLEINSSLRLPDQLVNNLQAIIGIVAVLLISALLAWAGSQGSVSYSGLPLFALCAAVGFVLNWLAFVPAYLAQTERFFDLTGSASYIATVSLALTLNSQLSDRGLILAVLIMVWALRLGIFLFRRIHKVGKDKRFDNIKTSFWGFLFSWTLNGAWVFITSAAALAAMTSMSFRPLGLWMLVGLMLWITGFTIETVADRQKTRFRQQPENRGKFITSGLWSRSRHPNYFGEILLWIGIAVIAFPVLVSWQAATLVAPLFVIFLVTCVSGIPMLEKDAEERWGNDPDYQNYKRRTPVLVPKLLSGVH